MITHDDDQNPYTPSHRDGHAASFDIDPITGQITVGAKARLDADAVVRYQSPRERINPYMVVVRAIDGDGETEDIDVNIHVQQYTEPPKIDRVYATGQAPPQSPATALDR